MGAPVLTLYGSVGPVTGSLRRDGGLRIMGSVLPGYRVMATGDVFISRNVRGARVLAGGGISVNGLVGP
ncbi:MAG: FapA family protein, partial [Planctomycetota bacterium]